MTGVDWGTVPAWASAILIGGSLLLGFYILLRDRRKGERADAQGVICWTDFNGEQSTTYALNTAGRPIAQVTLLTPSSNPDWSTSNKSAVAPLICADQEVLVTTKRVVEGVDRVWTENIPYAIRFTDADGQEWLRDLQFGTLDRGGWLSSGRRFRRAVRERRELLRRGCVPYPSRRWTLRFMSRRLKRASGPKA
ncbi:hypothetical protein ABZ826_37680 [Streptomyces sp. NPDC047515]|uniref:hypothetical protein n=1 Tax=Streptomyces sp. NPDC047515 TaxID=3155380 RepID=UPI0033D2F4FA